MGTIERKAEKRKAKKYLEKFLQKRYSTHQSELGDDRDASCRPNSMEDAVCPMRKHARDGLR